MLKIESRLTRYFKPWLENSIQPPSITAKEAARQTELSVANVLKTVNSGQLILNDSYKAQLITPPPQLQRKTVIETTRRNRTGKLVPCNITKNEPIQQTINTVRKLNQAGLNLKPKRLIRKSRYESHAPGGGSVVKSGFQQKNLSNQIGTASRREMKIIFSKISQEPLKKTKTFKTEQEVLKPEIRQFINWLKEVGFGNKRILGGKEPLLIDNLTALSQGEPVDFLIWNCIGFDWLLNQNGEYPPCRLNDNLETAITLYYQQKLLELTNRLSKIGSPNLFVLVPSNEALYEEMWTYTQPLSERQALLDRTVTGLNQKFDQLPWPNSAYIEALRWNSYLEKNSITRQPKDFSYAGTEKIISSPRFQKIQQSAIADGKSYFVQYGITVNNAILAQKRVQYEGMYTGEGIAFKEIMDRGKRIVVINLEEFRVAKRTFFGADENLSIITPVKPKEMKTYYQWENQIQKSRMKMI